MIVIAPRLSTVQSADQLIVIEHGRVVESGQPAELAARADAREDYSTVQDMARMVVKQYGGWWDDIPSTWNPAPLARQAREIAALAGGASALIERAQRLAPTEPAVACSLGVNAGHDLDRHNLAGLRGLPGLLEVSIGHAQICRALEVGTTQSVRELLAAL